LEDFVSVYAGRVSVEGLASRAASFCFHDVIADVVSFESFFLLPRIARAMPTRSPETGSRGKPGTPRGMIVDCCVVYWSWSMVWFVVRLKYEINCSAILKEELKDLYLDVCLIDLNPEEVMSLI